LGKEILKFPEQYFAFIKVFMIYNIQKIDAISIAFNIVNKGGVIIYPTDTLYGLGVDATNTNAIKMLNKIKKRKQVYSIIVSSLDMLKKYAIVNDKFEKFNKFLPGPYTVVLNKKKSNLSHLVSLELNTVGVRIPKHDFPIKIVKSLNRPIITTSVNVHGQKSLYNLDDITSNFNDIVIFNDDNINKNSNGSTILDFTKEKVELLRQGDGAYTL